MSDAHPIISDLISEKKLNNNVNSGFKEISNKLDEIIKGMKLDTFETRQNENNVIQNESSTKINNQPVLYYRDPNNYFPINTSNQIIRSDQFSHVNQQKDLYSNNNYTAYNKGMNETSSYFSIINETNNQQTNNIETKYDNCQPKSNFVDTKYCSDNTSIRTNQIESNLNQVISKPIVSNPSNLMRDSKNNSTIQQKSSENYEITKKKSNKLKKNLRILCFLFLLVAVSCVFIFIFYKFIFKKKCNLTSKKF
jgi:hypothetical protein